LALLAIGLTGKAVNETTEDYFLAGRKLRWYQIGFSLFATNFSASAIIGLTGAAYATGIAIYNYEWVGILAMVFFALFLSRVIRGSQVYTISEYLALRFDERIKTLYSVFIIFLIVFIDMAASLYAGGILLSGLIPDLSLNVVILLIMLITGLYSMVGGMKAITRTDIYQSLILILGAVLISYFTLKATGGWGNFVANTPDESLSLIRGLDDRAVPWTGLITGIPVLCAYFWLVNQNMVQWVLSANSDQDARRGLLFAGFMKLFVLFLIILPGVAAIQIIPSLSQPDAIYPAMLVELLPAGVLGLVLAGFVAAIMSNTDSTLHAASTIITMDFIKKSNPEISHDKLITIGRITTLCIIGASAIWAPMIGNFGTLFEYVQGVLSYAVAPFVIVYLGGLFWARGTSNGALWALVGGLSSAIAIGLLGDGLGLFDIHYLHVPFPVMFISLIIYVGVSKLGSASNVDPELIWTSKDVFVFSHFDKLLIFGLLGLTCLQVFVFR